MGGSPCHCGRGIEVSSSQDSSKNYLHTFQVCKQISPQMIKFDTQHKTLNSSLKHMFVQLKKEDNITTCTIQYKAGDMINNETHSILSNNFTRWCISISLWMRHWSIIFTRNICINLKIPHSYSNPTGGQHHHCNIQYPVDDVSNTDTHNTWRDQQSWWMMNNFYRVQVLRVIMDQAYQNNSNW